MTQNTIDQMLAAYRRDLPARCQTAQAIDRGASLAEISELAQAEGIQELAAVLFEAEQDALHVGANQPADWPAGVEEQIHAFRARLPRDSKTAQAIDQKAPWEEISETAEAEGVHTLAAMLFEAQLGRLG